MADKFSLDDIIAEYSKRSYTEKEDKKAFENSEKMVEEIVAGPVETVVVEAEETVIEPAETVEEVAKVEDLTAETVEETVEVEVLPTEAVEEQEQVVEDVTPVDEMQEEKKENHKKPHFKHNLHKEKEEELDPLNVAARNAEKRRESARNAENAAIISNLMKLRKERGTVRKNQQVTPVNRPNLMDIDMGLTGKIIPKTEEFDKAVDIPEDATYEEKTRIIYERRKKKIDSFKLKTVEDKKKANESDVEQTTGQKEFESYDQAGKILRDIIQVKSNLILRMCVLLVTGIFSILISLGNDLGWSLVKAFDRTVNPSAYVFTNTILGIISIGISYTVLLEGVKKLIKKNADCDSLAALGIFVSTISGIIMLFEPEIIQDGFFHMYMSVSIAGLIFNTLGKLLIVRRAERNFRYAAGEYDRYALINIDNEDVANKFTRGSLNDFPELATMRKTEFVEDFMKNSYSSDLSDRFAQKFTPLIVLAGVAIGLLSLICDRHATGFAEHLFVMLSAISGTISICSSMVLMLVVNVPLAQASKKYLHYSAVMLGYSSVEEFTDTNSVLVDAQQLFPDGMVDFVNLKLLSSTTIEECILMAASLACQANSVLKPTFYKMLRGKTEMLYPVESYIYEDGLGLSGWIENKRVLLGTRELMENHSIEGIPTLAKEKEYAKGNIVLYLSISGVVSTLFVLRASPSLSVSRWLQKLDNEGVTTVIRTVDGFISLSLLADLFGVNPSSLKLLSFRYHKDYENETDYKPRVSASMLCSGHFPSFAMLILGAKKLKFVSHLGVAMQFGAMVLGAVLSLIMMIMGAFAEINPTLILVYQLVFGLLTFGIQLPKKP